MMKCVNAIKWRVQAFLFRVERRNRIRNFNKHLPNLQYSYKELYQNHVVDTGVGNKVIIDKGSSLQDCNISFYGKNCTLHIGHNVRIHNNSFWFEDDGGEIYIGDDTTTESGCQFASCEGKKVIIGVDCMLSHDIDIRNTDSHSILNSNGERINPAADIVIGNHVWIGIRSTILKGSVVPSDSVISAQSMVTASLKASQHSLIAGIPAKVIKTNISWDRKRL